MGLQKDFENESGVTGNYWRITNTHKAADNIGDLITIALYKDKATRDALKLPILVKVFSFPYYIRNEDGEILQTLNSPFTIENLDIKNSFKLSYEWLKVNIDLFSEATDILEE